MLCIVFCHLCIVLSVFYGGFLCVEQIEIICSTRVVAQLKHFYKCIGKTTIGIHIKISALQVLHQCMLQQVSQK
jgi:hypothetical protein